MTPTEDRIIRAVLVAGPSPAAHNRQLERLRDEWPTLARSIAAFLLERGRPLPDAWKSMPMNPDRG